MAAKKARQQTLDAPGMAPEHHKDVSDAGAELRDAKDECADASKAKKKCEGTLIAAMKKHNIKKYVDRGLGIRVDLDSQDKVSVKALKTKDEDLA